MRPVSPFKSDGQYWSDQMSKPWIAKPWATKDRNIEVDSDEHLKFQRDIQNCMDCARYAGPMFKNISTFVVPDQ